MYARASEIANKRPRFLRGQFEPKGNSEPRRADRLRVPMGRHPRLHHSTTATLTRSIRDRGCTHGPRHETGHAVPESNPKSRVGRRRAVARRADNQARAMAAIAVGEREEWAAPQRVKPVHSGVPYVQHSRIRFPPWVSTATMCCRETAIPSAL